MFLPIGDDNRDRRRIPVINYLLIALNIFVFVYWQKWGSNVDFTFAFATVPGEILTGTDLITNTEILKDPVTGEQFSMPGLQRTPVSVFITLITSMFLHGGLAHLLGNMLYLWIFGDNLEDELGHLNYLLFYLLCGILGSVCHVLSTAYLGQNLLIPSLGASGAISGILGGYLLLHPRRGVHVWIFFFIATIPAFVVVGVWFVFQLLNGMGTLGGQEAGGIAYAAHIGGFVAGFAFVKMFRVKRLPAKRRSIWRK